MKNFSKQKISKIIPKKIYLKKFTPQQFPVKFNKNHYFHSSLLRSADTISKKTPFFNDSKIMKSFNKPFIREYSTEKKDKEIIIQDKNIEADIKTVTNIYDDILAEQLEIYKEAVKARSELYTDTNIMELASKIDGVNQKIHDTFTQKTSPILNNIGNELSSNKDKEKITESLTNYINFTFDEMTKTNDKLNTEINVINKLMAFVSSLTGKELNTLLQASLYTPIKKDIKSLIFDNPELVDKTMQFVVNKLKFFKTNADSCIKNDKNLDEWLKKFVSNKQDDIPSNDLKMYSNVVKNHTKALVKAILDQSFNVTAILIGNQILNELKNSQVKTELPTMQPSNIENKTFWQRTKDLVGKLFRKK